MARYYPSTSAAAVTPGSFLGSWDDTAGAVTKDMATTKAGAQSSNNVAETSTSNTWDACVIRCVGPAYAVAGTISGNVDWCFGGRDGGATMAASYHAHLWVMDSGGSLRGTLLADYVEAAANEWTGVSNLVGQKPVAPQAVTPVAVQIGDRLVLELGYRANNTTATSQNGRLYYGGTGTDMANGDTSTQAAWLDVPDPVAASSYRRPTPVLIG